eukprot:11432245-Karenia_brevis.AAC.1
MKQWVATTDVDDEGIEYVLIGKWERSFARFCTGKALDLRSRSKSNINCTFLDQLACDYATACSDAVDAALAVPEDMQDTHQVRHKRSRTAKKSDEDIVATSFVEVPVPPMTSDTITIDPKCLRLKFDPPSKGMGRKQVFWVELTVENLEYLRLAVLKSLSDSTDDN